MTRRERENVYRNAVGDVLELVDSAIERAREADDVYRSGHRKRAIGLVGGRLEHLCSDLRAILDELDDGRVPF